MLTLYQALSGGKPSYHKPLQATACSLKEKETLSGNQQQKNDDKQFLRTATFPSDESESSICK